MPLSRHSAAPVRSLAMSALGEFVVPLLQLLLLPFVAVIGVLVHVFSTFFDCACVASLHAQPREADAHARRRAVLFGRGKRLASPKSLVITGATAGIGEAFALHYAKPGVSLALTGRNIARLNEVAAACEARCARGGGDRAAGQRAGAAFA